MGTRHAFVSSKDQGSDASFVSKNEWNDDHLPLHNYAATTNPTATDDSTIDYGVGSVWINVTTKRVYFCVDATEDAAVWGWLEGVLGCNVTLVGSGTTYGASPNTINKPAGTTDGDLLIWATQTTNSIPNVAGPNGSGWTQALSFDTSSSEYQVCWYKVASSEGASWSLTHSAGSDVASAMIVLRGVDTLSVSAMGVDTLTSPSVAGDPSGCQVCVWFTTTGTTAFTNPSGITQAANVQNPTSGNRPSVLISYRDGSTNGAVPPYMATGPTGTSYHGALTMVFV